MEKSSVFARRKLLRYGPEKDREDLGGLELHKVVL